MNCKWISKIDERKKCHREADSSGYCIFHKENKSSEDIKLMMDNIYKEEINEFNGFIFENKFNAEEILTYDYKLLNFSETIFKQEANFRKYLFKKNVIFNYTDFRGQVFFNACVFLENCDFNKTKFNKVYINDKIFEKVKFKGPDLVVNKVENFPRMDGIIFSMCTKFILKNVEYGKSECKHGKINYRIARNQATKIGDYEMIGPYYYKERIYSSKMIKRSDYPTLSSYLVEKFFDQIAHYTTGYGEKPWNILFVIIAIISSFALLYLFVGIESSNSTLITLNINNLGNYSASEIFKTYIDLWYFSMATFSTVGYGDMVATSLIGKALAGIEVFLGVTIGAIWASVIIKRMIR
ncbi:potassium channel family protein [Clostridioides sp. ZZV14-6154]|uniref:potassium channel family protein n=1 Tax=unclassified Clostridioides TaxID=2635829 RepID=UPI001D10E281|nr:potassium channel family protein [Clostridioides sp. ZZV14-6154]MCC0668823.1 potassium channel family protein [Clostridioides sp. ZZV14-6153]MCC0725106.1 potassium channel family protein [Clostridioides sp. ZZV14-6045]MCC0731856.1 potassium channel family protein [Clostridioides sp. ZZV14-6048]MCC0733582.1 potassium channel family protein [Clostridioides sp. ZZV14-6009]MCC0736900.1 potassium channel family protein [Clostridioides sp. ZZV14-5902]